MKRGEDATLLLVFNSWHEDVQFVLPSVSEQHWRVLLDTHVTQPEEDKEPVFTAGASYCVVARSVLLFELV